MSKQSRTQQPIGRILDQRLIAYSVAGAAGIGILALPQSAEARVVYTATNTVLTGAPIQIDLNHDGITDFSLGFVEGASHGIRVDITPQVTGNAVRGVGSAACGFLGVPVGGGEKFVSTSYFGHGVLMAGFFAYGVSTSYGPWSNKTNRYVGLKFLINGSVHYGWARVSITNEARNVVLSGYAYETEPNTTIIEGHISGTSANKITALDVAPTSQSASLGMLARGAEALAIWRREEGLVAG